MTVRKWLKELQFFERKPHTFVLKNRNVFY